HLVVAKLDRVARDTFIAATIERVLAKSKASLASADGVGNGANPADAFLRTILHGVAEYERSLIRARTKAALQVKKNRGMLTGTAPFGFRATADGALEPDPTEQRAVQTARALHAQGYGYRKIAS